MSPAAPTSNLEFDHLPDTWNPQAFVPRRPIGLAVLCATIAAVSVGMIVASIFFFLGTYASGWLPSDVLPSSTTILGGLTPLSASVLVVFGGGLIGVSTALWRQEPWALYTVEAILVGGIVYLLATATFTVLLVLLALIFLYLVAIRAYFY